MAGQTKSSFLIIIITILLIIQINNNHYCNAIDIDFNSIRKSIKDTINSLYKGYEDTACIIQYRNDFDNCRQTILENNNINYNYKWYRGIRFGKIKDNCCDFIDYKQCLENVARQRCGSIAEETITIFSDALKNIEYPYECYSYNNMIDCMDTFIFWSLAIMIMLFSVAFIKRIYYWYKDKFTKIVEEPSTNHSVHSSSSHSSLSDSSLSQ